jgi:septum formation protein
MPDSPRLVLASASPRRAQILRTLQLEFRTAITEIDETLGIDEDAAAAAERLARAKALAAAGGEALPVLAADTLVRCAGRILGKPGTPEDAAGMLRLLSGRSHQVVTGVCVHSNGTLRSGVDLTEVSFAPLSEQEIAWYIATGEPLGKAGAYHIDGRGALFVRGVTGSPSNVAGLPVSLVRRLLRDAGVAVGWP